MESVVDRKAVVKRQVKDLIASDLTQPPSAFYFIGLVVPLTLPALVGMFVGTPALSREFDQGTRRLLWTQSISWSRWFFRKTSLLIGVVACAFALLFGFFSWWRAALLIQSHRI